MAVFTVPCDTNVFVVPRCGSGGGGGGGGNAPTGSVVCWPKAALPADWIPADGTVYPIATYPNLGALLGSQYGGDGITTFGVPNYQGRVPVGTGTSPFGTPRVLASVGGEEVHVLSVAELASHSHGVTDPGHVHPYDLGTSPGASSGTLDNNTTPLPGTFSGAIKSASTGISINSQGSNTGHNTMQPFIVQTWIIRT